VEPDESQTVEPVQPPPPPPGLKSGFGWALTALISFHAAQTVGIGWLLIPCAYALIELSRAASNRKVFCPMLGVGFFLYAPQLGFFWGIFGPAAIALWLVLAFWIALFGLSLRLVRLRFGNGWMLGLAPFIWTGFEYFRCELYYLRFGWLTFGMAGHNAPQVTAAAGTFLFGTIIMLCAVQIQLSRRRGFLNTALVLGLITGVLASAGLFFQHPGPPDGFLMIVAWVMACAGIIQAAQRPVVRLVTAIICVLFVLGFCLPELGKSRALPRWKMFVNVAGVQLEFPSDREVIAGLERAKARFPDARFFMLSEYTFQEPVPQLVRDWCASNQVYLVAGGREPAGETDFYDMAYVVGTNGEIVFMQGKSVPIQFFKDGLPAPERRVWDSPWGRMGILTCYDLSYTRVVDDFVRQGAIALLNPTMDIVDWGGQEHQLHSRVGPIRAAEYGIPVFRVASSGISQIISPRGHVLARASFPGGGEIIGGELPLNAKPRLPIDRWFAPCCTALAAIAFIASLIPPRKRPSPRPESPRSELPS